ncbi:MAG: RsmG family class I SAM-dependent methyltransferase [Thermoleophilia bacterium]|nr:16S rRNA (guanine(527)-N(7))-methyltransferase RsmG [Gaiellaceae bacterium]MDW8338488.1 RsmG family class I SAM-dependent methyltransferase [Thermoleophilia bacterium]
MEDALLERWLEDLLATPGLTAIRDPSLARRALVEDALRALPLVEAASGPIVDVGSGGGVPGIPLAIALPHRSFTLLEPVWRKAAFLVRQAERLGNVEVVRGRAEEQPLERWGVGLAKALAAPPVAAELTLPLVRTGGVAILWVGATADRARVARAAELVGGRLEADAEGLLAVRKVAPTPAGFPRRAGAARKRPLA